MPGSLGALGLLLVLAPGLLYLRRTENVRRPNEQTPLQEGVEVVVAGLFTSGLVVGAALLLDPVGVHNTYTSSLETSEQLRQIVLVSLVLGSAAIALSLFLAWARVTLAGEVRYAPSVWEAVFGERRDGFQRHVAFELEDGRTFDGPLLGYTTTPRGDGSRQLAIKGKIRVHTPGVGGKAAVYDYVVVDSSAIRFAAMTFVAD